ncbi:response regulator [bacterium]|nr:response regulator [bacterium]
MSEKLHKRILVVDDEEIFRMFLARALSDEGYEVETASDGDEAIALLLRKPFGVILTDLRMARVGGLEVLRVARKQDPDINVIIVTGYASLDSALAAIKSGAYDYITKPYQLEEVRLSVANASEKRRLVAENTRLVELLQSAYDQLRTLTEPASVESREDFRAELERRQREIFETLRTLREARLAAAGQPRNGYPAPAAKGKPASNGT